jgi:hypothetical protein
VASEVDRLQKAVDRIRALKGGLLITRKDLDSLFAERLDSLMPRHMRLWSDGQASCRNLYRHTPNAVVGTDGSVVLVDVQSEEFDNRSFKLYDLRVNVVEPDPEAINRMLDDKRSNGLPMFACVHLDPDKDVWATTGSFDSRLRIERAGKSGLYRLSGIKALFAVVDVRSPMSAREIASAMGFEDKKEGCKHE